MRQDPRRDPLAWEGLWWPGPPQASPTPNVVVHEHTCPDRTPVQCHSQWMRSLGRTVDRWIVHGYEIGTSVRDEPNTLRPDFQWVDDRVNNGA